MKSDRLLSTILLLQSHGQLTGRELAERLEVSERTVHRDMDALSAAGVPVFALRGSRGGWKLEEAWRTQVPGLDEAELHALLMAQPRIVGDPRLAAAAERALGKLLASLPGHLREKAASIRQRLYVDTTGWRGGSEDLSMLPLVQDAVARDRKLRLRYAKAPHKPSEADEVALDSETVERIVDPLGLVAKGSAWYLVANGASGLRTYRVSRIEHAVVIEIAARRPPHFELAVYWKNSTEEFRKILQRFEAILRLHPRAARTMKMWHPTAVVADELRQAIPAGSENWTTLRVQFDDEEQALFIVLGMGSRVEVVAPESLKKRIQAELTAMVSLAKPSPPRETTDSAARS
jgi:predicted DNA-binding transcriptional regulator YafY